jgi:hypothetical protein
LGEHHRRRGLRWLPAVALVVVVVAGAAVLLRSDDGADGAGDEASSTGSSAPSAASETSGADAAETTVDQFLERLRNEDLEAAAALWTGYPALNPDDDAGLVGALETFKDEFGWLVDTSTFELEAVRASGETATGDAHVVTAVVRTDAANRREAAAFVVAGTPGSPRGTPAKIQRLPAQGQDVRPAPGGAIAPGQPLVLSGVPVEGGAVAYVNGDEVPATVDHGAMTTTVVVPPSAGGEAVVTLVLATPELPVAHSFWFPVTPA